jgi:hypothetical protein
MCKNVWFTNCIPNRSAPTLQTPLSMAPNRDGCCEFCWKSIGSSFELPIHSDQYHSQDRSHPLAFPDLAVTLPAGYRRCKGRSWFALGSPWGWVYRKAVFGILHARDEIGRWGSAFSLSIKLSLCLVDRDFGALFFRSCVIPLFEVKPSNYYKPYGKHYREISITTS